MNLDLLDTNFRGKSHGDLILKAHVVADRLEAYPDFPPFPDHVYNPTRLRALAEETKSAVDAAKGGGKNLVQAKNESRYKLELELTILAQHVVMIYHHRNDVYLLQGSGFDVKAPRTFGKATAKPLPPTAPQTFAVTHGPTSGTALVTVKPLPNKTGLELQFTLGDPSDEASWKSQESMLFLCRSTVSGFEVAKRHYFRGRYHNASGVGPWSPTVSLIMI